MGHKGKFGHEFFEFEFRPSGKLVYVNNSQYKQDRAIKKEGKRIMESINVTNLVYVTNDIVDELKKMIIDSQIMRQDDYKWPVKKKNKIKKN